MRHTNYNSDFGCPTEAALEAIGGWHGATRPSVVHSPSARSQPDDTIRVFGLNDDTSPRRLPTGRQQALIGLTALLTQYDKTLHEDPARAAKIKQTVLDYPFSAVVHWLVAAAAGSGAAAVLGPDLLSLVRRIVSPAGVLLRAMLLGTRASN